MSEHESQGLIDFYSSQADLLLTQYENINQLLGPTSDWTHPGTHCEILLRDFLRRNLNPAISVDKGFVYGRVERDGEETHGPEIDILIHDIRDHHPIFRLEDFVIVKPDAVLGMIQVKRTLRPGKDQSIAKGLKQIVAAKQHLLDVLMKRKATWDGKHQPQGHKTQVQLPDLKQVFSAVVSFEDETRQPLNAIRSALNCIYTGSKGLAYADSEFDTGVYVLPNLIGSLRECVAYDVGRNLDRKTYYVVDSNQGTKNIFLQVMLAVLRESLIPERISVPPFAFPKIKEPPSIHIPEVRAEQTMEEEP